MCRFVAKNIVAKGLAKSCLVSVAYAIGKAEPLMLDAKDEKGRSLTEYVKKNYDFFIMNYLHLNCIKIPTV